MVTIKDQDKNKVAIVVVGYNRLKPIQRLLNSLLRSKYDDENVPLVISIDCSRDIELYKYVTDFHWPYGNKYVNIQEERLGLRNHIIQCGDLTQQCRAIILLEDDIFVSEYFYDYTLQALEAYEGDERIGGISLYNKDIGAPKVPVFYCNNGGDTFLRQSPESWGECWSRQQWARFKEWYSSFKDEDFVKIDMPDMMKNWDKAWTKYFMAYLIETNCYFVYPYFSLTTCFGDQGEHFDMSTMLGQTCFQEGRRHYSFKPFEQLDKYDIYCTNEKIYDWLKIPKENVCVDWYGLSKNIRRCRYILSPLVLPFKKCKTYGLLLRPIELNIKYNIEGENIFLYDTENKAYNPEGISYPIAMRNYYLSDCSSILDKDYFYYRLSLSIKKKCRHMKDIIHQICKL